MKKHGLAKFGQIIGNLAAGHIHDYESIKTPLADWQVEENEPWILYNVNIVDVINGKIKEENSLVISGKKISELAHSKQLEKLKEHYGVKHIFDGKNQYLIPGLSDLHCHLSLISEYKLPANAFYYFDAQREKNCENALKKGCTFARDSGGAYDMIHGLMTKIEENRLLGPKIFPSYQLMTSRHGMWDMGALGMKMGDVLFGGAFGYIAKNLSDVDKFIEKMCSINAKCIKFYLEEKPIYGGRRDQLYNMFSQEMVNHITQKANEYGKVSEAHSMFIKGSRMAIKGRVTSIAHLTVDESYSEKDAYNMAQNNVAIVPTTTLGCYLAMNFRGAESQDNDEFRFYRDMLEKYTKASIQNEILPQLKNSYSAFFDFVREEMPERKMPMVGEVYPERIHGFHTRAPESFANFRKSGTKIGMGTDGGTGLNFAGNLAVEFAAYKRYGLSEAEILKCATINNMEILGLENELGSLDEGKYADMVLIGKNPLTDIEAVQDIKKVYKNGRCYVEND
ncbi:MAG: amidohydrolase family protein [Spirochaetales bacterium]|nr:amidohydrolase family protein [Spirochaetales bacterium]